MYKGLFRGPCAICVSQKQTGCACGIATANNIALSRSYTVTHEPGKQMNANRAQAGNALLWIVLLLAIAGAAYLYFYVLREDAEEPPVRAPSMPEISLPERQPAPEPEPEVNDEPVVQVPTEEVSENLEPIEEPLPSLAESDADSLEAARALLGDSAVRNWFVTEALIPRFVATVNALTGDEVPGNILPVYGPDGAFNVTEDGLSQELNPETGLPEPRYALNPANFDRYAAQVSAFEQMDTASLVAQYDLYYPLLQQSYAELGNADAEFNERLIEVIDHLLAAPEPERVVSLVKPEAYYEFESAELEALSAGHKVFIRMGPSNASRVKAKLAEIRDALQTQRE